MKKITKRAAILFLLCMAILAGNLSTATAAAQNKVAKSTWSEYTKLKKKILKSGETTGTGVYYIDYMGKKEYYCITYYKSDNALEFDALLNYSVSSRTGRLVSMLVKRSDVNNGSVKVSFTDISKKSGFTAVETIKMATFTGKNGTCKIKRTSGNPGKRSKMIRLARNSVNKAFSGWDLVLINKAKSFSLKKLGFPRY